MKPSPSVTRRTKALALVAQDADPLLVSGAVLADVCFDRVVPVVEYRGADLEKTVRDGDRLDVDADTGEITVN